MFKSLYGQSSGEGNRGFYARSVLAQVNHNMKAFLPGGAAGTQSGIYRGLASKRPVDIGPLSDDLFERISNSYYAICLRGGLIDCESLINSRRTGGGK